MQERYKTLITGSCGMLGTDLGLILHPSQELYGVDVAGKPGCDSYDLFTADITDSDSIGRIIDKVRPDVIVHAAAWTDVDGCELDKTKAFTVNKSGTENVARHCAKVGAVMIYISTDFVFDGRKKTPYKETDKTGPLSVYGSSKLAGEDAVRDVCDKYYILRTSWLYGKNGKNFVDTIIAKSKTEKCLSIVDDQIGSPTNAGDLSIAISKLLARTAMIKSEKDRAYGIYHVSNSGSVSWYEYAKTISNLEKINITIKPISSQELGRPAKRPAMSVLDCSKFTNFTGYKMRAWETALKEYLHS